jgi:hypothetical protein
MKTWEPRLLTEEEFQRFIRYIEPVRHGRFVCWKWTGKVDRFGYGRFWLDGQWRSAHRIAYVAIRARGATPTRRVRRRFIPADLSDVDHGCVHSSCVRAKHLKPETAATNQALRAMRSRKRARNIDRLAAA